MRKSDGVALSLIVAGLLVFSLTSAGVAPLSATGGVGGGCTPGADAFLAYVNSNGAIEMDGFSCPVTGGYGGVAVYGWAVGSSGSVIESVHTVSDSNGNFALVFGSLPEGTYSLTASLCAQDNQSACVGQVNWTTTFDIAGFTEGQNSTVTVVARQTQTSSVVTTTTNGCTSDCGPGKPVPLGYWLSLGLLVSGVLVFALGFVYKDKKLPRILGAYLVLTGVGALVLSAIPGLSGVFALQPVSLPTLLLLPQSVESSLAGAFLTGPPSMWASFVMFAVDALVGLGLMLPD